MKKFDAMVAKSVAECVVADREEMDYELAEGYATVACVYAYESAKYGRRKVLAYCPSRCLEQFVSIMGDKGYEISDSPYHGKYWVSF